MYILLICLFFVIFPSNYCAERHKIVIGLLHVNGTQYDISRDNHTIMETETVEFQVADHNISYGQCMLVDKMHVVVQLVPEGTTNNYKIFLFDAVLPGKWSCVFFVGKINPNRNVTVPLSIDSTWYSKNMLSYILSGFIVVLLLTVICLLGYIIFYRYKAKAPHGIKTLSAMHHQENDRVRYSKYPMKRPLIETTHRDSVIYEALDALQIQESCELPPIETLPGTPKEVKKDEASSSMSEGNKTKATKKKEKKKKAKKETCAALDSSKRQTINYFRRFTLGKKTIRHSDTKLIRNSIDRIKNRPPLRVPTDEHSSGEDYEEMPTLLRVKTQEPAKSQFNSIPKALPATPMKPENTLKKAALPPPPPSQIKPQKIGLKPNVETVNELENILKNKILGANKPVSPSRPTGLQMVQQAPSKVKVTPPTSPAKPVPTTLPKPSGLKAYPKLVTAKPVTTPPMNAPVPPPLSTLPRPTRQIPVEVVQEDAEYNTWDGEEWTYEPLKDFNIYSV